MPSQPPATRHQPADEPAIMNPTCSLAGFRPAQARNAAMYPAASRADFERALSEPVHAPETCTYCGGLERDGEKLSKCIRCKSAAYCDGVCQGDDWEIHKLVCRQISEARCPTATAEDHRVVCGPWQRIFVFFPDEKVPSVQWARDYRPQALRGMSIQYHGRYCNFLARTGTQIQTTLGGQPHYNQRRTARVLLNDPHPAAQPIGHAVVLTSLAPYPGNAEPVNKAILALAAPGHSNLLFGPVCVLAFEAGTGGGGRGPAAARFPGRLRSATAHDLRRAIDFLRDHPTSPAVCDARTGCMPALKLMGCMDATLVQLAAGAATATAGRRALQHQQVRVTVSSAHRHQWPSAVAFCMGLRWYVREVVGYTDACGVDRRLRWLLLALRRTKDEELLVERREHGGTLLVFSAAGVPVRLADMESLVGAYEGIKKDATLLVAKRCSNLASNGTLCVFEQLDGKKQAKADSHELMKLVAKDQALPEKIELAIEGEAREF